MALSTYVLSSSERASEVIIEGTLGGGLFSRYLLRGLAGEASREKDGSVRFSDLKDFVTTGVRIATNNSETPVSIMPGSDLLVVGPRSLTTTTALLIGNARYSQPELRLRFAESDAQALATFWQSRGATTNLVVDGTRAEMLKALDRAATQPNTDLAIFYYSGHAVSDIYGTSWLLPVDANVSDLNTLRSSAISTTEIKEILNRSSARAQVLFFDAGYSPLIFSTK